MVWKILTTQAPPEQIMKRYLITRASVALLSAHDRLSTTRTSRVIMLPSRDLSLRNMMYNGRSSFTWDLRLTTGLAVKLFSLAELALCELMSQSYHRFAALEPLYLPSRLYHRGCPGLAVPREPGMVYCVELIVGKLLQEFSFYRT
jgi:hypothetical protein